jgi:hypothetical protein
MRRNFDFVTVCLIAAMSITVTIWLALEALHNDGFRNDATPMPRRSRNLLMWIAFIEMAALTFWETQHGRGF